VSIQMLFGSMAVIMVVLLIFEAVVFWQRATSTGGVGSAQVAARPHLRGGHRRRHRDDCNSMLVRGRRSTRHLHGERRAWSWPGARRACSVNGWACLPGSGDRPRAVMGWRATTKHHHRWR
jgi:hypothetical protein